MTLKVIAMTAVSAVLACIMSQPSHPANASEQSQVALKMIADFADRMCEEIPLNSSKTTSEINGKISIELKGLVSKLASAGVQGAGKISSTKETRAILEKDIGQALKNKDDCRFRILKEIRDVFLPQTAQALKLEVDPYFAREKTIFAKDPVGVGDLLTTIHDRKPTRARQVAWALAKSSCPQYPRAAYDDANRSCPWNDETPEVRFRSLASAKACWNAEKALAYELAIISSCVTSLAKNDRFGSTAGEDRAAVTAAMKDLASDIDPKMKVTRIMLEEDIKRSGLDPASVFD